MAPAIAAPPQIEETRHRPEPRNLRKIILVVAIVIVVGLCAAAIVLIRKWPFTQAQILQNLKEASDSQVQIESFRQTFFPTPGCVIEGLVFHHEPGETKPLITIQKLTIESSYTSLLAQRVSRITAEGLLISIPPFDTHTKFHTSKSEIETNEIVANGAIIEFGSSEPGKKPLRFDIHEALLRNVGWKGPLTYRVKVHNPEPPGEVSAEGKFGVWDLNNAGETPISGKYKFEQADLSVYNGIAGTLDSTGSFAGKLAHIDITGTTDTPNFVVTESKHPVHVTTKFSAYVDATKGDTFLKQVDADFRQTHIVAQGSVASYPGRKSKTALIDLHSTKARIDDLLLLFVKANRAPMSGSVTIRAHVEIPPGESFLKKVKLRGSFGIAGGTFTPSTQENVDKLSAGARGEKGKEKEDPETVLTDLEGQVELLNGVARFSDLSFRVPGAHARVEGTYNLINYKIDLRGRMRVDTKISDTSSGGKSFLLKMMDPIFKKKPKGEVVPVKISGDYDHPTFGLDLGDTEAQKRLSQQH
jgi:hypothetical protein